MIKCPVDESLPESGEVTPIVVEVTHPMRPQCLQISVLTLYALGSRKPIDMNKVPVSRDMPSDFATMKS